MSEAARTDTRADELFHELRDANLRRTSRLFAGLMAAQWAFGIGVALVYSPYAWEGKVHAVHAHVWIALFLGGAISSLPIYLALTRPTAAVTRYVVAIGQMLWSGLLIHLSGGRIETHFHVFGSLAFLAFYRDWKVLLPATIVVATDHLARQMFWPESVFGMLTPEWWRFLEHALWVVFEDTILIASCIIMTEEMRGIARARAEVEQLSVREAEKSKALQLALDELAAAQDARLRGEKLAAVGQLAASVGHELRNPLAAVRNANTFIGKKVKANGADPKVVQFTELIERELDVCTKIIGDLLDFARERPLVPAPTPLRDLVESAVSLVPSSAISIVNRVPGDLPVPTIDKEQFRQVLINLVQNAVEAMEPRGSGKVIVTAEKTPGMWRVIVEDDGPGIAQDVVAKMFEPLFTTKVKGTGLGLAIVAGIIKRHGGAIRVDSKVGRGTRCVIEWSEGARLPGTTAPPFKAAEEPT
jgi:signal transduction histidine kinase